MTSPSASLYTERVITDMEQPTFLGGIAERCRTRLEGWIDEQFDFILQVFALVVVYIGIRLLRYYQIGTPWFLGALETLHEIAALLIFACWLFGMVRRRYAAAVEDE